MEKLEKFGSKTPPGRAGPLVFCSSRSVRRDSRK
jgi:hypothetical protein